MWPIDQLVAASAGMAHVSYELSWSRLVKFVRQLLIARFTYAQVAHRIIVDSIVTDSSAYSAHVTYEV